jgi:hypothetical protein
MVDEYVDYAAFGDINTGIAPDNFVLGATYPNPATHRTHIPFQMYKPGQVRLEILDSKGAVADVLTDRYLPAGSHMVSWDCQKHPAGFYICQMRTGGKTLHGKIMVMH